MVDDQDGYRALCTTCRAEVGPRLEVLPRARLTVNANGDLIMRTSGTAKCPFCGTTEIEIQVAPATRSVTPVHRIAVSSGQRPR